MSEHTYTCLFEPDEDGGFVVTCPALPGLVTHGDTLEEAREHATEAIELYLESVLADGERLPISEGENVPGTIREPVTVTLPAAIDTDEQLAQLERAGAGDELLRIINRPKWRGTGAETSEKETWKWSPMRSSACGARIGAKRGEVPRIGKTRRLCDKCLSLLL